MTDHRVTTKSELLAHIERDWTALHAELAQLSAVAMTTKDDQGWTVKDHIVHLMVWENSAVFFLQSKPRHIALGVSEAVYLKDSEDDINAAIFQNHQEMLLTDALAQFREIHSQLMTLLQLLTDADLQKPYSHYLPNEPSENRERPAINVIYGNTAHHFAEHLGWMQTLTGASQ